MNMENLKLPQSKELIIHDIFNELELTTDGMMNQKEFLETAKHSEMLWTIIDDCEQKKLTDKDDSGFADRDAENNFYPPYN